MRYLKSLAMVLAADVFSLFIGLTLAGSSMPLVKGISAVCTVGILAVIMADFAIKTARDDIKNKRDVSDRKKIASAFGMGFSASAPAFLSWIILYISVSCKEFNFYRWHKIINGYFLQIYNFINADATSSALSINEVWMMFPLAFIPVAVFVIAYVLAFKRTLFAEK
ncbi:MAG: hypothetical protein NC247_00670 [Ruminococcus flavefaciens]|nr:hypothetical protein [Ruminococcus flavefaciens]MCM1360924.1 hypothetical protein [Clostridiales bacterium]MCM1435600.1 hypothetical protein [Ruminococcus flavefaciens]